jgi:hypothetical protein
MRGCYVGCGCMALFAAALLAAAWLIERLS